MSDAVHMLVQQGVARCIAHSISHLLGGPRKLVHKLVRASLLWPFPAELLPHDWHAVLMH
jgi:hypothetical protein